MEWWQLLGIVIGVLVLLMVLIKVATLKRGSSYSSGSSGILSKIPLVRNMGCKETKSGFKI